MPESELQLYVSPPLTPRQDRIEASIERVLRAGGTRSELREMVEQFADLARMQQIPPERALTMVKAVAMPGIITPKPPILKISRECAFS